MKIFWLRLGGFCALWGLVVILYSKDLPVSILIFSMAVAVYFFLSLKRASLALYSILSVIIFLHGLLVATDYLLTTYLLLYMTVTAAFWMKEKPLLFYMAGNLLLSILLGYLHETDWLIFIIMLAFYYFLIIALNRFSVIRKEQKEIQDRLLGEYRRLKRMNLAAEDEARMAERTKIAREIHDSVGHRLTDLIMTLEMQAIEHDLPAYRELKNIAETSLSETREAVKALQTKENEGIASVVYLIRKLESQSQMLVQFTMKQGILSIPLSNEKSVALYRVIQEALTNAMRHAQSREIHITLGKAADGAVSFSLTNKLFDQKSIEFGFGLSNMKKRVKEVNGDIDIYRTEDQFIVAGSIPEN